MHRFGAYPSQPAETNDQVELKGRRDKLCKDLFNYKYPRLFVFYDETYHSNYE